MSKALRYARAAAVGAAALLVASFASGQEDRGADGRDRSPTLTVSATAEVSVQPDRAVVRLGVLGQAAEASAAQDQVNQTMQRIQAALRERNVPDRAIRTEDLSLYPVYSDVRPTRDGEAPQEPRITGYRASNVVSIEVDELATIGDVIDAGIGAGANQLQGVSFELRNDAAGKAEAMRLAVEEARAQADAVADSLGMRIAGVRDVIAGGYGVQPPPMPFAQARVAADLASTPVQPGQVGISASVTITYELGASN